MAKWFLRKTDVNIELMSKTLKISPILSVILANRGIKTKHSALKFLNPAQNISNDTSKFKDIDKAVEIIIEAVVGNKKIAIYGDYDVDGVMSVTILYKALKAYGADVIYYIPHRELEGYGMNITAVDKLNELGIDLIITCDNGISAINEIEYAKKLSMQVIVIDHHEPGFSEDESGKRHDVLPAAADAVIDAKQQACEYPFKDLCAAGVSYKFMEYFYKYVKMDFALSDELLILASIATVCDIVDLLDENRLIVKRGLELINSKKYNESIGLAALIKERGLTDKKIGVFEIGFILGPCINATGRLETALISAELFTCGDARRAEELAKRLASLNEERKAQTTKCVESALNKIQQQPLDKVIVIFDEEIHESIAGIVAGRIKDSVCRPAIVLTKSGSDNVAKGSARSIEGYNIFEELYKCRDLFERFGGHEMAAGLSLANENIGILKKRLNDACQLTESDFEKIIRIDKEIPLSLVTFELANELKQLEPFGKGNKEPVFGTKGLTADLIEVIGENKKTLKFTFTIEASGRKLKAVCFNKLDQFLDMLTASNGSAAVEKFKFGRIMNIKTDVIYHIGINEYNNNTYVEMKIIDFRL